MKLSLVVTVLLGCAWSVLAQDEIVSDGKVVCKRDVVCKMACTFGFKTDEDGCPTCHCNPNPCEVMNCPEGQKCELSCFACMNPEPRCIPECPMVKCMGGCESGRYFHDQYGCQTCDCIPGPPLPVVDPVEPCAIPMCLDECPGGYQESPAGCQTCDCLPVPPPPPMSGEAACPGVMCAMFCEYGFAKDERGCDMCKCNEQQPKCECPLPLMECNLVMDEECKLEPCELKPQCTVPTLCHFAKAMDPSVMDRINKLMGTNLNVEQALDCAESGEVNPLQCTPDRGYCWCVDDRGVYVPGTKRQMIEGKEEQDMCASRKTLMMQVAFQLLHDLQEEDVEDALEDIKRMVVEKMSQWLGMDQEVILRIEVTTVAPGVLRVDVNVMADGSTDMPSAAVLMQHYMDSEGFDGSTMSLGDHLLRTKPGTLETQHIYDLDNIENFPVTDPSDNDNMWEMVLYPALGAILFVTLLALIVCVIQHRKRSASYQFAHKKMENMENFKKNLILSSEWEKPELLCKDDVIVDVEKKPLA